LAAALRCADARELAAFAVLRRAVVLRVPDAVLRVVARLRGVEFGVLAVGAIGAVCLLQSRTNEVISKYRRLAYITEHLFVNPVVRLVTPDCQLVTIRAPVPAATGKSPPSL
jgi:hypothetical protein